MNKNNLLNVPSAPLRYDVRVVGGIVSVHAVFILHNKAFRLFGGHNDAGSLDRFLKVRVDGRPGHRLEPFQLTTGGNEEPLDEVVENAKGKNHGSENWRAYTNLWGKQEFKTKNDKNREGKDKNSVKNNNSKKFPTESPN